MDRRESFQRWLFNDCGYDAVQVSNVLASLDAIPQSALSLPWGSNATSIYQIEDLQWLRMVKSKLDSIDAKNALNEYFAYISYNRSESGRH